MKITLEVKGRTWYLRGRGTSLQHTPIMHEPQCCLLPVGTQHCGWSSRRALTLSVALLLSFVTPGS